MWQNLWKIIRIFRKILTFNQLPHDTKYIEFNSDHINERSQGDLLIKWQELINKYILFLMVTLESY